MIRKSSKLLSAIVSLGFTFSVMPLVFAQSESIRVLLVLAHPDDETMAAGQLSRLKERGFEIHAVYATRGENGRIFGKQLSANKTAQIREEEMKLTAEKMGIASVTYLDAPDIALRNPKTGIPTRDPFGILQRYWNTKKISDRLRIVAERIQADIVISMSFSPGAHGAHKAIRIITQNLFRLLRLGTRAKSFYAIDEGNRIQGAHEQGEMSLRFPLSEKSMVSGRTYGEMVRDFESLHASQRLITAKTQREYEELVLVDGVEHTKLTRALETNSCRLLF
jgi:LmbE family N-acetylglucosaminyl deacetylase